MAAGRWRSTWHGSCASLLTPKKGPTVGTMTIGQSLKRVFLALLAVMLAAPAAAQAGSLLSGYGGPGDGSQAILGSALTGGGPSGGEGGSGTAVAAPSSTPVEASPERHGGSSQSDAAKSDRRTGGRSSEASAPRRRAARGASARLPASTASLARAGVAPSSEPFGLTAGDILDVGIALVLLSLTAALTWFIASGRRSANSTTAKGMARQIRVSR
jgi:hypothetical protein